MNDFILIAMTIAWIALVAWLLGERYGMRQAKGVREGGYQTGESHVQRTARLVKAIAEWSGENSAYPWRSFKAVLREAFTNETGEADKLAYLTSKVTGKARDTVTRASNFKEAMSELESMFGNDQVIKLNMREEAKKLPKITHCLDAQAIKEWWQAAKNWRVALIGVPGAEEVVRTVFQANLVKVGPSHYRTDMIDRIPSLSRTV